MKSGLKHRLDYDDLQSAPDDGMTYEILDGKLYVTPAPSPQHQRFSKRLQRQLESFFEADDWCEVFNAPLDVILGFHDVVQPDIVVVERAESISRRGIEGAPLLVVEVLSPSTGSRDRSVKAERYARLGIPHYWIVDPEARRIEVFRAREGAFHSLAVFGVEDAFAHPDWPDLTLDLPAIWR